MGIDEKLSLGSKEQIKVQWEQMKSIFLYLPGKKEKKDVEIYRKNKILEQDKKIKYSGIIFDS